MSVTIPRGVHTARLIVQMTVSNDFNADINLQILSAADKYSALTEKRTYKKEMPPKQALTIIYQDVKDGKLHPFVFKALVNYVNSNTLSKVS